MNYILKKQMERLRYMLIPSAEKRSLRVKKKAFFAQYIKFHNNIKVASDVIFITHDIMHKLFNDMCEKKGNAAYKTHLGCIEIMDNVFIGTGSIIMPDVRIGPNVIVGAGSVVTKDIPEGTVVAGVPAKVIGTFDEVMLKRERESACVIDSGVDDRVRRAEEEWNKFYSKRNGNCF